MELCKKTLENFIENRNNSKKLQKLLDDQSYTFNHKYYFRNLKILLEITKALNHLHSKEKIIHRDLKPQNIFFSTDNYLKIGDFGLATDFYNEKYNINYDADFNKFPRKDSTESNKTEQMNNISSTSYPYDNNMDNTISYHTKNIGTLLYSSPEQLNVNFYDYKSDIFSLGLIFYELLFPFRTSMEKKIRFNELKSGKVLDLIKNKNSIISNLILSMTDKDPKKRPSTEKIIQIIKSEINKVSIEMKYNDEQQLKRLDSQLSNSFNGINENYNSSSNSHISEDSQNPPSRSYFNEEDSKMDKSISKCTTNFLVSPNESFTLILNSKQAQTNTSKSKLNHDNHSDNNFDLFKDKNLEKLSRTQNSNKNCNCKKNDEEQNIKNNNYQDKINSLFAKSTYNNDDEKGININIYYYEGESFPAIDIKDKTQDDIKLEIKKMHVKKHLKIINFKMMIYSEEYSKKADQIYEMSETTMIYDPYDEEEIRIFYQLHCIHSFLKDFSLYFDSHDEYFKFCEYLAPHLS